MADPAMEASLAGLGSDREREEWRRLVNGDAQDPHRLLGAHPLTRGARQVGAIVRSFHPDAIGCDCWVAGDWRTMEAAAEVHVSDTFIEHVVDVVGRTRGHADVELGASPRAGIALLKSARARALIRGRRYVIPDDLYALAPDVVLHRTRLNYEALADGKKGDDVLQEILHDLARGRGREARPPAAHG